MAGLDANKVYMPTPIQSKTVGAVAAAPLGTAAPSDARTALPDTWDSGGYVNESGLSLSLSRSMTPIKDWSMAIIRKVLTEFDGTIGLTFLQADKFALEAVLGEDNVTVVAADTTHGEQITAAIGPQLPPVRSYCFSMKDGERRVRVYVPCGQVTEIPSNLEFVPSAVNAWASTISCYDDGTGHSIYVIYDDGQVVAA